MLFSLFWILAHSCLLFPTEDVQWSFPVFHIKKKQPKTKHIRKLCQKQLMGEKNGKKHLWQVMYMCDTGKALWVSCCCDQMGRWWFKCTGLFRPTFRTCIGLRAGVCETFQATYCLCYTGVEPSDWSCAAPVKYIDRLDSARFCVVGCVMKKKISF